MGMNLVVLNGNLGQPVEVRFTKEGRAVATLSVATNEKWKDKDGKPQERVEWHRVVAWGGLAETCGKYLRKGSGVIVQGRLQTREWADTKHPDVKHHTTEIHAENIHFVSGTQRPGEAPAPTEDPGRPVRGGDAAPAHDDMQPPPGYADTPAPASRGGLEQNEIPF